MKTIFNRLISFYLDRRYKQIEQYMANPIETQDRVWEKLMVAGRETEYGKRHGFKNIKNQSTYSRQIPLVDYENIRNDIQRMMHGEKDILWPGEVSWFSKSSGTTSDKSKFIPVSQEKLLNNHIKSSWDVVNFLYNYKPDSRIFADKNLVMGGSLTPFSEYPKTIYGDISAIMLKNMPAIGRPFYTPDFETALLPNWNEKLERMVEICSQEQVVMFGGVPTWVIVLFNKILEYTNKSNMLEVWPDLQVYVHGGVGFGPYVEQFKRFIPSDDFLFLEVYNASEGYFAIQNDLSEKDMLLLLDNGIYYEFIPMHVWGTDDQFAIPLSAVEVGVDYAMVISTTAGLWRYQPGDTIQFTNTNPYKIIVTGRTKHFINVFGEELMIGNTDKALSKACAEFNLIAQEYMVAPIFIDGENQGGHEWIIEFEEPPKDPATFAQRLDLLLQAENSDYEAKRFGDLALLELKLVIAPRHTFQKWMASKGKLGGQNKVPRLSNDRKNIEHVKSFI